VTRSPATGRQGGCADEGFSLVELVTSVAVLMLVVAVVFATVDFFQSESVLATNGYTAVSQAQVLMEVMTRDVRAAAGGVTGPTAPAFAYAADNEMRLYANLGDPNGPTLLHIYTSPLTGSALAIEGDSTRADSGSHWTYNNGPTVAQFRGQYVDNTAGPVFTYYDPNGNVLPASPSQGGVSNLSAIESIQVTLTVRVTPSSSPTTLTTRIHLRNIDYNPNGFS
jgi:Tfp pilus assembly protein PilW